MASTTQDCGTATEGSAFPELPVFDYDSALRRFSDDAKDLEDIVQMFMEYAPVHLRTLRAAQIDDDVASIREIAHRLSGAAGNLSALAFRSAAASVEKAAFRNESQLPELIANLELQFERLTLAVRECLEV